MKTLAVIILISIGTTLQAQNAREIADRASKVIDFEAMEMVSTLKIYDNRGNERVRRLATASKKFGSTSMTLIRFLAPADVQGTTMLVHDHDDGGDDMWIYLPSLRRERRIVSSEKGNSFMGSEFTNADMTRPNLDEFNHTILGTETVNGKECWKVESACKTEDIEDQNGFSRMIAYIEKGTYLTHRVEYYDLSNRLHRVMTINDYKKQPNGKMFAFRMESENVQNQRRSEMIVEQFQLGSELTEANFSVGAMSR